MILLSVKVYGWERRYFEYITCKKVLLCFHEKNRKLLVKENLHLRFFQLASQFLAAIAEETTKKTHISYESLPRLVKLFLEKYPS